MQIGRSNPLLPPQVSNPPPNNNAPLSHLKQYGPAWVYKAGVGSTLLACVQSRWEIAVGCAFVGLIAEYAICRIFRNNEGPNVTPALVQHAMDIQQQNYVDLEAEEGKAKELGTQLNQELAEAKLERASIVRSRSQASLNSTNLKAVEEGGNRNSQKLKDLSQEVSSSSQSQSSDINTLTETSDIKQVEGLNSSTEKLNNSISSAELYMKKRGAK